MKRSESSSPPPNPSPATRQKTSDPRPTFDLPLGNAHFPPLPPASPSITTSTPPITGAIAGPDALIKAHSTIAALTAQIASLTSQVSDLTRSLATQTSEIHTLNAQLRSPLHSPSPPYDPAKLAADFRQLYAGVEAWVARHFDDKRIRKTLQDGYLPMDRARAALEDVTWRWKEFLEGGEAAAIIAAMVMRYLTEHIFGKWLVGEFDDAFKLVVPNAEPPSAANTAYNHQWRRLTAIGASRNTNFLSKLSNLLYQTSLTRFLEQTVTPWLRPEFLPATPNGTSSLRQSFSELVLRKATRLALTCNQLQELMLFEYDVNPVRGGILFRDTVGEFGKKPPGAGAAGGAVKRQDVLFLVTPLVLRVDQDGRNPEVVVPAGLVSKKAAHPAGGKA